MLLHPLQHRASSVPPSIFQSPKALSAGSLQLGLAQHSPAQRPGSQLGLSQIREPVTIWTQLIMAEWEGSEVKAQPQSLPAPTPQITLRTKQRRHYHLPTQAEDKRGR